MTPAWSVRGLTKHFGTLFRPSRAAVDGVDFEVAPGERVALIGESGSGKTTLARCGLGLVPCDAGTIRMFGEDAATFSAARWRTERRRCQLLFQDPRAMLHPNLTVGALLAESARVHRAGEDAAKIVAEVLERVGLGGREHALPRHLSGGEQRRAGLARVLLARPSLLVADEPTAGLDAALKADLIETLLDRVGPECAVVLISHDLAVVAWACQRVVVMAEGKVVDTFSTDWLRSARTQKADLTGRHPYAVRLLAASGLVAA